MTTLITAAKETSQDSTIFRFPAIFHSCESHDLSEETVVVIMESKPAVAFLSIYPCFLLVHPKDDLLSPFNVCK